MVKHKILEQQQPTRWLQISINWLHWSQMIYKYACIELCSNYCCSPLCLIYKLKFITGMYVCMYVCIGKNIAYIGFDTKQFQASRKHTNPVIQRSLRVWWIVYFNKKKMTGSKWPLKTKRNGFLTTMYT